MRARGLLTLFWGMVGVLGGGSAGAQLAPTEPPEPAAPEDAPPPPPPVPVEVRTQVEPWRPSTRFGAAVLLGGGVDNFVDSDIDAMTGLGGAWNLRLVSGTRQVVGAELAYVGDARDVTGPGITEDDFVLRTGIEGALRLQLPFMPGSGLIEPFALVGLGWSRYSLVNEASNVTFMGRTDDQLSVPFGGGLNLGYRGFMFDARFIYRLAAADDMFAGRDMAGWNLSASLGAEF